MGGPPRAPAQRRHPSWNPQASWRQIAPCQAPDGANQTNPLILISFVCDQIRLRSQANCGVLRVASAPCRTAYCRRGVESGRASDEARNRISLLAFLKHTLLVKRASLLAGAQPHSRLKSHTPATLSAL